MYSIKVDNSYFRYNYNHILSKLLFKHREYRINVLIDFYKMNQEKRSTNSYKHPYEGYDILREYANKLTTDKHTFFSCKDCVLIDTNQEVSEAVIDGFHQDDYKNNNLFTIYDKTQEPLELYTHFINESNLTYIYFVSEEFAKNEIQGLRDDIVYFINNKKF